MCKRWGYYVRLVCALFCISCTLFLNTLQVNADGGNSQKNFSGSFDVYFDGAMSSTGGYISNGTGTITNASSQGGTLHFKVPIDFVGNFSDNNISSPLPENPYSVYTMLYSASITASLHDYNVYNVYLSDENGTYLNNLTNQVWHRQEVTGVDIMTNVYTQYEVPMFLEFDISGWVGGSTNVHRVNWSCSIITAIWDSNSDYSGYTVHDSGTQKKLDDLNTTEQDTNTTTHSIFSSISDFFGSFFSNLIGVFVPEDGFFTTWFNNLNTLLEAKLGILYYPFAKVIYLFNQLSTAFSGSANPNITFPGIEFTNSATGETYTFLSAQNVNLNDFNITTSSSANSTLIGSSGYGSLIDIIRTLNGFVLVMALLGLLRQKLNLILRGEDNDS